MSYQGEKFQQARRNLMLPHTHGEADSVREALREMSLGLYNYNWKSAPESVRFQLNKLESLLSRPGLRSEGSTSLLEINADEMDVDERLQFSIIVDELAYLFDAAE